MTRSGARIGVDVGGTKTEAVVVDASGEVVARVRRPTRRGTAGVVATIADVVEELRTVTPTVHAVGLGVAGVVDAAAGRVTHAVNLDLVDVGIADLVHERLGVAVHLENDVKAAAVGAASLLPPVDTLAYLNLGTGVAAGLVIGGRLWRGTRNATGEVGHVSIDPAGPPCSCGQRGCIEALCGGGAVAARRQSTAAHAVREVFDAAKMGDAAARSLRVDVIRGVVAAVRVLCLAVDADVVVIGGGVAQLGDRLLGPVADALSAEGRTSPFLASLALADRIVAAPAAPVAALGAALLARDADERERARPALRAP